LPLFYVFVGAGFDNFALGCNFSLWVFHILAFGLIVKWVFVFLFFALTMLFGGGLGSLCFQTISVFGLERSLELALFFSDFNNLKSLTFALCLLLRQFFLRLLLVAISSFIG
jgi:hypothetical protein